MRHQINLTLLCLAFLRARAEEEVGLKVSTDHFQIIEEAKAVTIVGATPEELEAKRRELLRLTDKGATAVELDRLIDEKMLDRVTIRKPHKLAVEAEKGKDTTSNSGAKEDSIESLESPAFRDMVRRLEEADEIMLTEEEALGLNGYCRIYTYCSMDDSWEQHRMLKLWLRSWFSLGVRPKILRREDTHGKFILESQPTIYGAGQQWFETDHFVKWMALYQIGGGTMVDADVFGMRGDLGLAKHESCFGLGSIGTHERFVGSVVSGNKGAVYNYVQELVGFGHQEMESRATKLLTDKTVASKYRDELFRGKLFYWDGLMSFPAVKVLEESKVSGKRLDRAAWANEMLKLNLLNRYKLNIAIPQDTGIPAHPARALLETIKCPSGAKDGWHPAMPSSLADLEAVLPVPNASCFISTYGSSASYRDILKQKPIPDGVPKKRPTKEPGLEQGQKTILLLEDPVSSAWARVSAKRPALPANPISRFFFGDRFNDPETFDFSAFNMAVVELLMRLEKEEGLITLLLDRELAHTNTTRLLLEYGLGIEFPEGIEGSVKRGMAGKMDRGWKNRFEDGNQPDIVFYMIARSHYERREAQVRFLELQLKASTSEIERMPTKMDL